MFSFILEIYIKKTTVLDCHHQHKIVLTAGIILFSKTYLKSCHISTLKTDLGLDFTNLLGELKCFSKIIQRPKTIITTHHILPYF